MFSWFDTKAVVAFADSVTAEFLTRVKPDVVEKKVRGAEKIIGDARDLCLNRVEKFAMVTPLNIYKRAKLANLIRWKLLDAGLSKDFVTDLVLAVARKLVVPKGKK